MKRMFPLPIGVLLASAAFAAAMTGPQVLQRIRAAYERVNTFQASFDQTFVWKLAGTRQQMRGQFLMKKPNRFRLQSEAQTVVTDGRTVWSYSPATKQVIINDYDPATMPLRPDNFLFQFPDERRARYVGASLLDGARVHVVDIAPQDSSYGIRTMRVWVDDQTWVAKKVQYLSVSLDTTTYVLQQVQLNPALPDSVFKFTVPRGTEVVDFRSSRATRER